MVTETGRATSAFATSAGATSRPSRPVTPAMVTLSGTTVSRCAATSSGGSPAVESVTTATGRTRRAREDMRRTLVHQAGCASLTWNGVPCMQYVRMFVTSRPVTRTCAPARTTAGSPPSSR